jgi:hypothetical protein
VIGGEPGWCCANRRGVTSEMVGNSEAEKGPQVPLPGKSPSPLNCPDHDWA